MLHIYGLHVVKWCELATRINKKLLFRNEKTFGVSVQVKIFNNCNKNVKMQKQKLTNLLNIHSGNLTIKVNKVYSSIP